jgi:hypothetical protein
MAANNWPIKDALAAVTIANGQAVSGSSGDLGGRRVLAVITDAAWDTQGMTFQGSADGSTWFDLYDESTEYALTGVVKQTMHKVNVDVFLPCRYLKVRSGTAAVPANQNGATVVTLVTRLF